MKLQSIFRHHFFRLVQLLFQRVTSKYNFRVLAESDQARS